MAKILFLAHRIPYPPNKGDKIRSWNFLRHLARKHDVQAGFFIDDPSDIQHVPFLENYCAKVFWEFASPRKQKLSSLRGFLTGHSLTEMAYPSNSLRDQVAATLDEGVDLVFLYSAACRSFLPETVTVPVITDFVDVDSEKWKAYSSSHKGPMAWAYGREGRLLADYERRLAQESRVSIFVSGDEANLFRKNSAAAGVSANIVGIPNGVETDKFDPSKYTVEHTGNRRILFTGAMDYAPNIEAVVWFVEEIFPRIVNDNENVEFFVAGRPVAPAVAALGAVDSVTIVGGVNDMAAEISHADIVVAPLLTARGIQNKVLEGMAMAKPVVCTQAANEGINAPHKKSILVADTAQEFADAVTSILKDQNSAKRLGLAARSFVADNNSWEAAFSLLDDEINKALVESVEQEPNES